MAEYIVSKGETVKGMELEYDSMFILKGGTAEQTKLNDEGDMYVSNGGKAVETTINQYGQLHVSKGGTVKQTTINEYGWMYVSKGGTATDTTVNSYGWVFVSSGGKVDNATVSSGGIMIVSKGGTLNNADICFSGYFGLSGGTINKLSLDRASGVMSSGGGTINDLTMNGGFISFYSGTINRATVQNGNVYVYSGGKLNSAAFNGGHLIVSSNCTANKITLENGAGMDVYQSGAKASGVTVKTGGSMYVGSGGVLTNVTFTGGDADILNSQYAGRLAAYGGTIKGLTIGSGTSIGLFEGCTATKISWTPGNGVVNIWSASTTFTSKYSGVYVGSNGAFVSQSKELVSGKFENAGSAYVAKGGLASGLEIGSSGHVYVWSGGKAEQTRIGGEGFACMDVSSGGIADGVTILGSGVMNLSGGKAGDVTVCGKGVMNIYGGSADGVTIESGGSLEVISGTVTNLEWTPFNGELYVYGNAKVTFGGEVSGVYVGTNGELTGHSDEVADRTLGQVEETGIKSVQKDEMFVMSGGKAERTAIGRYGSMYVFDGGSADDTSISNDGEMVVCYGGAASGVENNGGWLAVYGGTVTDVTLNGSMFVAGGSATGVIVGSGAYGYIQDGGLLKSATLCSGYYREGGVFYVSSGAVVSDLVLEYGACLYVSKGAKVTNVTSSYGSYIETEKGASVKKIKAVEAWSPDCDYDALNGWADKKKKTINDHIVNSTPTVLSGKTYEIRIDEEPMTIDEYNNYVGYGDEIDFLKVHLDYAARLNFSCTATDASKFTVWRWDDKKNKLVSLQASALKLEEESYYMKSGTKSSSISKYYAVETKNLLLESGDYYISMESTNAAKGGNAYYKVFLSSDSCFFEEGNTEDDDWATLPDKYDLGALTRESQAIVDEEWVGFGDDVDYRKFTVAEGMKGSFDVYAIDISKFTLYQLVSKTDKKGKTTESLKKLKSVTIKTLDEEYGCYRGITGAYDFEEGVEYYYCMESTNAAKGGSAYYHVDFLLSEDVKAPADAAVAPLADLDGKSVVSNALLA